MTTSTHPLTFRQRAAWAAIRALAEAAAWAISFRRDVEFYSLTDDECEARGLPLGTAEPSITVQAIVGASWWRVDAWDDGDGCFNLRALGMWAEVYHQPRGPALGGA